MADSYVNLVGRLIKLIDNGDGTYSLGASVVQQPFLKGVATGGNTTTLADSTRNIDTDFLKDKVIIMTIDGVEFTRVITGNTVGLIQFAETMPYLPAIATIGTGEESEGQVQIACKGDIIGTVGDGYAVKIDHGTETTGDTLVDLDVDDKILNVTVNLSGTGDQRSLGAAELQTLLDNAAGISDMFEVLAGFTAGLLPITGEPIPFENGIDGVPVVAGTDYVVL